MPLIHEYGIKHDFINESNVVCSDPCEVADGDSSFTSYGCQSL